MKCTVSRRSFMVGLAGFGLAPILDPFNLFRYRQAAGVAIVGLGGRGAGFLEQALNLGIRVLALCDLQKDAALAVLENAGVPAHEMVVTNDFQELLQTPLVDAVVFAVPPASRADLVRRSVLARKHVLVPAPFASHKEETTSLYASAAAMGCMIMDAPVFWHWDAGRVASAITFRPVVTRHIECEQAFQMLPGKGDLGRMSDAVSMGLRLMGFPQASWVCSYQFADGLKQAVEIHFRGERAGTLRVHDSLVPDFSGPDQLLRINMREDPIRAEYIIQSRPTDSELLTSPTGLSAFIQKINNKNVDEWAMETAQACKHCQLALAINESCRTGGSVNMEA